MKELVRVLVARGVLKSENVIQAFRGVDRADFVLPDDRGRAYFDAPLAIGFGQTISQPTVVAFMLELLLPRRGERVLDVGSGSGWTTTLLASLVGEEGRVTGVEIVPELVAMGARNLAKYRFPWAEIMPAGKEIGLPREAPFHKILVSAAAPSLPQELVYQLKDGGAMAIPIESAIWHVRKGPRGKLEINKFEGFAFVPLILKD